MSACPTFINSNPKIDQYIQVVTAGSFQYKSSYLSTAYWFHSSMIFAWIFCFTRGCIVVIF